MIIGFRPLNYKQSFSGLKDQLDKEINKERTQYQQQSNTREQAAMVKEKLYARLKYTEKLGHFEISKLEEIASDYQYQKRQNQFAPKPEILTGFTDQEIDILAKSHSDMISSYWDK